MTAQRDGAPSAAVAALAAAIEQSFFDHHRPGTATVQRVDQAFADALDGVEWLLDRHEGSGCRAEVDVRLARAAFDLLVEVRRGRCDRATTRSISGVVLHRLIAEVGLAGPSRPLVDVLGALTILPGEEDDRSFDPTPDPAWPLEAQIATTLGDPATRLSFLASVADSELHLPIVAIDVDPPSTVQFVPLLRHGQPAIAAYTSPERMNRHARAAGVDVPGLVFRGRELAAVLPAGHGVVLNPGSVLGLAISGGEVRGLAAAAAGDQEPR